jgi:hypothetical protein
MAAVTCEAPDAIPEDVDRPSVFLAGSIDQGAATDWQSRVIEALAGTDCLIFNPRRRDWDASWDTDSSHSAFREQVEWELAAQERADLIAFYFEPGSRAPVTMLELGLAAGNGSALVCCPESFWRSGNVDLVCQRYGIEQVDSLESLGAAIVEQLGIESEGR